MYSSIFPNAKLITLSAKTYDIYHFFSFYLQKYVNRFTFFADWSAKVAISDVYLFAGHA